MTKAKGPSRGPQGSGKDSRQVYATRAETELLVQEFPSWHPSDVLMILRACYRLAQIGSGAITLHMLSHGQITFHCDGVGSLMIDPSSSCTSRTQELVNGIRLVLDGHVSVGVPEGEAHA